MSTGSTPYSDGSLLYSIESISNFLNNFQHPRRGVIYKALLDYASFGGLIGPYVKIISYLNSEGIVSTDEIKQALNCAVAAFPGSLEGAKGTVLSFLRQVATTNSELYIKVVAMIFSCLPNPQLLDRLRQDMELTESHLDLVMDASVLISHSEPSWMYVWLDQSAFLHVDAVELEMDRESFGESNTSETAEAGSSATSDQANGSSDTSSLTPV